MKIRAGYQISYDRPQPTPMILTLSVHPSRFSDLRTPNLMRLDPPVPANSYHDAFGNFCHVIRAPAGRPTVSAGFSVQDSAAPDDVAPEAVQHSPETQPVNHLVYLLGSRNRPLHRIRVVPIREHPQGGAPGSGDLRLRPRSLKVQLRARQRDQNRLGRLYRTARRVRDFARLAVTLCRCMNIPARYCAGYLGDIGVPPDPLPMDFSAWFEVYLGNRWHTFDARHNKPRIGRVLMARGHDANDVAIVTSFGPCTLAGFKVITEESRQLSQRVHDVWVPRCFTVLSLNAYLAQVLSINMVHSVV